MKRHSPENERLDGWPFLLPAVLLFCYVIAGGRLW